MLDYRDALNRVILYTMSTPVTLCIVAILALLVSLLGFRVSGFRLQQVPEAQLQQAIRVHGNLTEYAPIFAIALLTAELNGGQPMILTVIGGVFVIARFSHAWGLGRNPGRSMPRFLGILGTWVCISIIACYDLLLFARIVG